AASREIVEHRAGSGSRRVGPPSPIVPVSSGGREEPSPEFTVVHAWLDSRFGFGLVVTSAAAAPPARTGGGRRQLAPRPFRPLRPLHAFDPLRLIHLLDLLRLLDLLPLPPRMFRLVRFVLRHQVTVGIRHPADGLANLVSGREAVPIEIVGHLAPAHVGIPVDEGPRLTDGVSPAKAKEDQGLAGGKSSV